jgi:hypothetical protein
MFKTIDTRCLRRPILLSTRTDIESVQRNKNIKISNAVLWNPFYCALIAFIWKQEEMEKRWIRLICSRRNCSSIRALIIAFAETDYYFPTIPKNNSILYN